MTTTETKPDCRRCDVCAEYSHHWSETDAATSAGWTIFGCKHCDAMGIECSRCDGEGIDPESDDECSQCEGEAVIRVADLAEAEVFTTLLEGARQMTLDQKIRKLLDDEIDETDELSWCRTADDALDLVRTGVKMRIEELEAEME